MRSHDERQDRRRWWRRSRQRPVRREQPSGYAGARARTSPSWRSARRGRQRASPASRRGGQLSADGAAGEGHDDLTAIKGLGKVKAAKLVASGITSYAQIAAWTDDDIAEIGLEVNTSPGQIKREDWVGQAKRLAEG